MICHPRLFDQLHITSLNCHWDVSLPAQAEAALVSAEYSFDGVNWQNSPIVVERDFSIKLCTLVDVLKFDAGTTGTAPTYYRAVFDED